MHESRVNLSNTLSEYSDYENLFSVPVMLAARLRFARITRIAFIFADAVYPPDERGRVHARIPRGFFQYAFSEWRAADYASPFAWERPQPGSMH
jgi:hypothetical protein